MKRLLIVLSGVLAFQGSVWALTSQYDLCQQDGNRGEAGFLSPADTQQLNKGSPILLQWQDKAQWLESKVNISLYSRRGGKEQAVKTWPSQINTGSALITRADLRGGMIKKASTQDIRYFFRLTNHANAKRFIDSGCFTFTKSEKGQRQRKNLREEIAALETNLNDALSRIEELTERLEALEEGGVPDGVAWASLSYEENAGKTACWDMEFAITAHNGIGWVVGANRAPVGAQDDIRRWATEDTGDHYVTSRVWAERQREMLADHQYEFELYIDCVSD